MSPTANRNVRSGDHRKAVESPQKIKHDLTDAVVEYARENPGYAALTCLAIGFVLGWKLKPW
jgi:hypothetical protein